MKRIFIGSLMLVFFAGFYSVCFGQQTEDNVLATWNNGSSDYETLCTTQNGNLVYKRSNNKNSADFYVRETMATGDVISIETSTDDDTGDITITVSTRNAIFREHHAGGEKNERQTSKAQWFFPKSEKAKADTVFQKLKSLTRR